MFANVLPENAQTALAVLGKSGLLQDAYLAGGTALALFLGHRQSVDFDFFTNKLFDPVKLSKILAEIGTFKTEFAKGISLIGYFREVKMSYFRYDYPLLKDLTDYQGIKLAHIYDIAAMKMVAICDRNTKKDLIDIYAINQKGITLDMIFDLYEEKYHVFDSNKFTLIKSLSYFEDAETDDMPVMYSKITWQEVKDFFVSESLRLGKKYLEG